MSTIKIGPTFVDELRAAGARFDGLGWGEDGTLLFSQEYPEDQRALVRRVFSGHNPLSRPVLTLEEEKTKYIKQVRAATARFAEDFWPGLKRTAAMVSIPPFGTAELAQLKSFCAEVLATQTAAVAAIQAASSMAALAQVMADLRAMYGEYLV